MNCPTIGHICSCLLLKELLSRRLKGLPAMTCYDVVPSAGVNTFFGRAAALIGATNNVANIQKVGGQHMAGSVAWLERS